MSKTNESIMFSNPNGVQFRAKPNQKGGYVVQRRYLFLWIGVHKQCARTHDLGCGIRSVEIIREPIIFDDRAGVDQCVAAMNPQPRVRPASPRQPTARIKGGMSDEMR